MGSGTSQGQAEQDDDYVDGGIKPLAPGDPSRIGPYLLLGRLGAGGMGRVFLARSEGGRTVAVKVVHEEHVADAQFRARFRREIDAARRVGERYTAPVLDADPDAQRPWVATGYVPGLSLEQIVRRHGPLPVESVHALADGLLHALKDIHTAGIVHRDLKPSNVMLTVEGARVIDFGISRALETSVESLLTSTGMVVGSPGFMSPEQVRGQRAGAKSDVFTLGCVLMYAATGELPFGHGADNQHAVMFQIVEGDPDLDRVADEPLRALMGRCLAKGVEERPGVDELLADPERVRPAAPGGAWLPPGVVERLARQAARLLDAEAVPAGEKAIPDRATVGLRPETAGAVEAGAGAVAGAVAGGVAEPVVGPDTGAAAGGGAPEGERRGARARRRWTVAVPAVLVFGVGGGTVALIQPFGGGGGGAQASPPASSGPVTPGAAAGSPSAASGSPAPGAQNSGSPQAPQSPTAPAPDGQSAAAGAGTPGGGSGTPGGSSANQGGAGGPAAGGTSTGAGPGGASATPGGSGSGSPSGGGSPTGGGSSGGDAVPAYFAGTWTYKGDFNIGQPSTVIVTRAGAVRLIAESNMGHCENIAKVVSVASGGKRINIGAAAVDKSKSTSQFCGVLDPSFFTRSEPVGLQHNVGPSHGEGYYYQRS
ncbi:serine/threonine-protein kinase [Streptomyces sp. H34-S4]|uniref:serine/threonine-protein kinase n=1 Tax=Streptomyces sp. H34-S4 TaxID=2996463 RepID=UPI00226E9DE1|nr:serine/threonine-protein kinase [Streptomyces sp. H34-S4]MCY0939568.1 serine/threonine-protein kinase [Streptomyces sp. H34-S4]